MYKTIITATLLSVSLLQSASADKICNTYPSCLRLADSGNAQAQFYTGNAYWHGLDNAPVDKAKALTYYTLSANQNNPDALYILGYLHHDGLGVKQDYGQALGYFHRASQRGDRDAQHALGWMYKAGNGTPIDYLQSYLFFSLAVDNGHDDAKTSLTMLHLDYPISQAEKPLQKAKTAYINKYPQAITNKTIKTKP